MIVLDTNHLSILDQDSIEAFNLGRRLAALSERDVAVTIITSEEQMRGWLAYVARANTPVRQVEAYAKLRGHVERFRRIPVLDYNAAASSIHETLKQTKIRVGTMDLNIAAIALANNAVLLTRNLSDFNKVPGLQVEDWSV